MQRAVQQDGRVRVIYKDWPIFGPISERAARVALASHHQGIYAKVYDRLMTSPASNDDVLRDAVQQSGGDWKKLMSDLQLHGAEIDQRLGLNSQQAIALGLPGTPGYLIGPLLIKGAASQQQFRRAIQEARDRTSVGGRRL